MNYTDLRKLKKLSEMIKTGKGDQFNENLNTPQQSPPQPEQQSQSKTQAAQVQDAQAAQAQSAKVQDQANQQVMVPKQEEQVDGMALARQFLGQEILELALSGDVNAQNILALTAANIAKQSIQQYSNSTPEQDLEQSKPPEQETGNFPAQTSQMQ